jgi:predicted ArsR family transcriptional regulator
MTDRRTIEDPLRAVALLGDPNRQRLYELVVDAAAPVSRDAAAAALGIRRELAAFHLDRMVDAGLLETEYRRLGDRRGPGAGRPSKLYRRVDVEIEVSLPPRAYERLAGRLAEALSRSDLTSGMDALRDVARSQGWTDGRQARRDAGRRPPHRRLKEALLGVLRRAGYEPTVEPVRGDVYLRNCPYQSLAASHRDLTCGMNLAWAQGVISGLEDPELVAELAPASGRCCVVFGESPDRTEGD